MRRGNEEWVERGGKEGEYKEQVLFPDVFFSSHGKDHC